MSNDNREEICPDCKAGPHDKDATVTKVIKAPETGVLTAVVTWHRDDCPTYTVDRILLEDGVRRAKESDERGRKALPAAYARITELIARAEPAQFGEASPPFAAALVELVEAQLADLDRFLPPYRWAEILDKHFPPSDEEPTR